jgi:hypothetical protein
MPDNDFDWSASYVLPARLRLRPTPAGALQVDGEAADVSVEVARDQVPLLLAFARPLTAAAAYDAACREREVDRDGFRDSLQRWEAQGLLRTAAASPPTPARLALFAKAADEFFAQPSRRFPLRSPFELQRPVVYYPGLDTREIHDRRRLPWVATLESSFAVIQQEFSQLLEAGADFANVHRAHTSAGEWAAAYLWAFGRRIDDTCRRCPETVRALAAIPGVAQFGTTLFSALAPHTQIAPHHGYTNAKLRCQLPLRVPAGCRLKVGDQEVEQQEGRCIVFDDSFLHCAWNDSDEARFVLVFDFFHPDLTAAEIFYLSQLAHRQRLAEPYLADAAVGDKVGWVTAPASLSKSPEAAPPAPATPSNAPAS